jgi:hypothetical protein
MKRTSLKVVVVMLLVPLVLVIAGFVIVDRDAWLSSRTLSVALRDARSVGLIEFTHGTIIARSTATPDEIARLQKAANVWIVPFVPKAFYCFEPHHRVEILRADGSHLNVEVCFLCEKFTLENESRLIELPPALSKSLASFFASVGMVPKTQEEYLRRERREENEEARSVPR